MNKLPASRIDWVTGVVFAAGLLLLLGLIGYTTVADLLRILQSFVA